tara:strand:- start:12 stop:530 length:519 start_codon:yes stop_codon:yes gene_type:complete
MVKNLDKLEQQLSSAKSADKNIKDLNNKLWGKIYEFEKKVFKKHLDKDLKTLQKFFAKHSKDGIGLEAKIIGRYLEIEKSYNAPELDYSSETIKLEMVDSRAPAWSAKTEFLKKYHYDEKYFKLKVAREGDYTIDGAMGGRPIISTKLFDLDKKDDAYQYMTDLFKKEFLGL